MWSFSRTRNHRDVLSALVLCSICIGGLSNLPKVDASVMAIDLGSEYLKISILKPGRIPISIVTNEMSKRKTPAAVAFVNDDRLIGEEAASLSARYPDRVITKVRNLLGRRYDDLHLEKRMEESMLPFEVAPAENRTVPAVAVKSHTGHVYSAEELVASLLEYAKKLADAAADGEYVRDCVLVVPPYFTLLQRQALLDAASLAGLNVLSLVHSHTAAALQYGIEREFGEEPQTVLFYDLGFESAEAALVKYSSYEVEDKNAQGKSLKIPQLEVLDVAWVEHGAGGDALEVALLEHFAAKHPETEAIFKSKKAIAKLRKQVKRTKEILSANTEAPISVEELLPGVDLRNTITREEFETIAERNGIWKRAVAPVVELLKRNNLTSADLSSVELLGGSSRVPKVKSALQNALDGRALDMHLDADEAVVLGAGLMAANLSTIFRLRKFGVIDKTPFEIKFTLNGLPDNDGSEALVLVPSLKKMPTKRSISNHNLTVDSFLAKLSFHNSIGSSIPEDSVSLSLGTYNVSGIQDVISKYGYSGKVALHTTVDSGGVFRIEKADANMEVEEEIEVVVNATEKSQPADMSSNDTTVSETSNDKSDPENISNDTSAETSSKIQQTEKKTVVRKLRLPLKLTFDMEFPALNSTELASSRKVLRILRQREEEKRNTAKARNDLEEYIIDVRGRLNSDDELISVSTEEQREAAVAVLNDAEEWLYGDGESATASELRQKLKDVRKQSDDIEIRAAELSSRNDVVPTALSSLELYLKTGNAWSDTKPWLNETEAVKVISQIQEIKSWIETKVDEQSKLQNHEDPAFRVSEVLEKIDIAKRVFNRLNNRPKPVEKPPPTKDEDGTEDSPSKGEKQAESTEQVGDDRHEMPTTEDATSSSSTSADSEGEQKNTTQHDEL